MTHVFSIQRLSGTFWFAGTSVFRARWTDRIHDEWIRNVHKDRPELSLEALERCRHLMDRYIPDCLVEDYEGLMATLELPDVDDRHIIGTAKKRVTKKKSRKP